MIRKIKEADYPRLIEIWDSAVSHTHNFLVYEDFLYYKRQLTTYFQNMPLYGFEQHECLVGFMGVAEGNIEMLFIHNDYRGMGIGKKLISYAINTLRATRVDVNEQNTQAVGFYKHMGFSITNRSALDADGKEYPILHMQLQPANE